MSSFKAQGNVSGTGEVTLETPNTNTNRTITLPDATTTLVGTDATQTLTNKTTTTQTNGDNSTKLASTAYVQAMGLGWDQTWQAFTSPTRQTNSSFTWASVSTRYTNSTGKPICVSVGRYGPNGYRTVVWVSGVAVVDAQVDQYGGAESMGPVIVPPGAEYAVSVSNGAWCNFWNELR